MAEELEGKAYEVATAVALSSARRANATVRREVSIPDVSIRADITTEVDAGLKNVLLVTHATSEVDYHKKFLRDSAELIELVATYPTLQSIGLIMFDASTLPGLTKIANATFPLVLDMEGLPQTRRISDFARSARWLQYVNELDTRERGIQQEIPDFLSSSQLQLLRDTGSFIWDQLDRNRIERSKGSFLGEAGSLVRSRDNHPIRSARCTRVRHGTSKLVMFSKDERKRIYKSKTLSGEYMWAERPPIALLTKAVSLKGAPGIYRVSDSSLVGGPDGSVTVEGVLESLSEAQIETCLLAVTDRAKDYVARIRNAEYLDRARDYVEKHYSLLSSAKGMEQALRTVSHDPPVSLGASRNITWHWLYTYLVAFFKAASGKKQGFGTTAIARLSGERRFRMQNSILSDLEYAPSSFPEVLYKPLAVALSKQLISIPRTSIAALHDDTVQQQLVNELRDKLLCHALNPLPTLLEDALRRSGRECLFRRVRLASAQPFGTGNAGTTEVVISGHTLIWWRSAHGAENVSHKRKELQTRGVNWRLEWDVKSAKFRVSDNIKRAFLVLDGDFRESDLRLLSRFGWDDFFYADELDKLIRSIV